MIFKAICQLSILKTFPKARFGNFFCLPCLILPYSKKYFNIFLLFYILSGEAMKIIAHRGASFYAPENTMSAFKLAMEYGVDGIEMDVHVTKDGRIVVIHDDTTGRTGTYNLEIKSNDYETLKKVDVGSWFDKKYQGEEIPLLDNLVKEIPFSFELYIEIKSEIDTLPIYYNFFCNHKDLKKRSVIFGFNYDLVAKIKELLPDFTVLWIVEYGYNVPISNKMYCDVYEKIEPLISMASQRLQIFITV